MLLFEQAYIVLKYYVALFLRIILGTLLYSTLYSIHSWRFYNEARSDECEKVKHRNVFLLGPEINLELRYQTKTEIAVIKFTTPVAHKQIFGR